MSATTELELPLGRILISPNGELAVVQALLSKPLPIEVCRRDVLAERLYQGNHRFETPSTALMIYPAIWIALTWVAATLAILGSLMALGSLLLGLVPASKLKQPNAREAVSPNRYNWLKLLGFAIAIALIGFILLALLPFPAHQTIH